MKEKLKKIITNMESIGESFEGFAADFAEIDRYSVSFENKVNQLLKDSGALVKWLAELGDSTVFKNKKTFLQLIKALQHDINSGMTVATIVKFRNIPKQNMAYYFKCGLLKKLES